MDQVAHVRSELCTALPIAGNPRPRPSTIWLGETIQPLVARASVRTPAVQPSALVAELRDLVDKGVALPVVGAGASLAISQSPVAGWTGFLGDGIARCRALGLRVDDAWLRDCECDIESGEAPRLLRAAENLWAALPAGERSEWFAGLNRLPVKDPTIACALRAWRRSILTTNFDDLLERASGLRGWSCQRSPGQAQQALAGVVQACVHTHGVADDLESIVMSRCRYDDLLADPSAGALLQASRSLGALVFVGCGAGLDDPAFENLFAWARRSLAPTHLRVYRLVREQDLEAARGQHHDDDRVALVTYGTRHEQLGDFLWSLAPVRRRRLVGVSAAVALLALIALPLATSFTDLVELRGRVLSGDDPIPHAIVYVAHEKQVATTNEFGQFELHLRRSDVGKIDVHIDGSTIPFELPPPTSSQLRVDLRLNDRSVTVNP